MMKTHRTKKTKKKKQKKGSYGFMQEQEREENLCQRKKKE